MVAVEIIAVCVAVIFAAIGWVLKKFYKRIQENLERLERIESDIDELENQSDTLMSFLFGRERVKNDDGLTEEVRDGMEDLSNRVESNYEDIDEIEDVVDVVVIRLHKSDNIKFDKEELDNVVELGVENEYDESFRK